MTLSSRLLHLALAAGLGLTFFSALNSGIFLFGLIALVGLLTLPGLLVLLALRARGVNPGEGALLSVALSLAVLMVAGLAANTLVLKAGYIRPLSAAWMVPLLATVCGVLWILSWARTSRETYRLPKVEWSPRLLVPLGALSLLPVIGAIGALRLSNGGGPGWSVTALTLVALIGPLMVLTRRRILRPVWSYAVFCLSLTLLWATSLRGHGVTGHDLQLEYYVYALTAATQSWSIDAFRDAYNACMSITVLPVILESLTGLSGLALYKVVYPVVFALGVAGLASSWLHRARPAVTFVAAYIFLTLPVFMSDMPMLARQEIAFVFFIALVTVLLSPRLRADAASKPLLLLLLGLGLVLSHYSSTFVAIAILGGGYGLHLLWLTVLRRALPSRRQFVGLGSVVAVALIALLWFGPITGTGKNLTQALGRAQAALTKQERTSAPPLAVPSGSPHERYAKIQTSLYREASLEAGGAYPKAVSLPLTPAPQPKTELTSVGAWLAASNAAPERLLGWVRAAYTAGVAGLLIVGLAVSVLAARRKALSLPTALAVVGVGALVLQALVPAVDYGLLRMLQQFLIVAALPALLGLLKGLGWLRLPRQFTLPALAIFFSLSFLTISGVAGRVTGGVPPTLQTANAGLYYDGYYTTSGDLALYRWLDANYPDGYPLYSDYFLRLKLRAGTGINAREGIVPGQIPRQSYVVLGGPNVTDGRVDAYQDGQVISFQTPERFFDENKSLIYSSPSARVYR